MPQFVGSLLAVDGATICPSIRGVYEVTDPTTESGVWHPGSIDGRLYLDNENLFRAVSDGDLVVIYYESVDDPDFTIPALVKLETADPFSHSDFFFSSRGIISRQLPDDPELGACLDALRDRGLDDAADLFAELVLAERARRLQLERLRPQNPASQREQTGPR